MVSLHILLLGITSEKQIEKQVGVLKSLDISNKKDELKQIEGVFPKDIPNDLIINKLKETIKLKELLKQIVYIIH